MAVVPTDPAQLDWRAKLRDLAYKTFWTAVFAALATAGVMIADLPVQWIPVAAAVLNVVGGHLRQLAGAYAPPPAQEIQALRP